jgi:hypothetical protein
LLLLAILSFSPLFFRAAHARENNDLGPYPFSEGEKLRYSIYADGIKIGNQTMEVEAVKDQSGVEVYVIKGQSKSSSLLSIVYRLDDRWIIWMKKQDLLPIWVEKDWAEGRKEGLYHYEIDQDGGVVTHRNMESGKIKTLKAENTVFDLFSLLYYYRANAEGMENPFTFDFLESKAVRTVHFKDEGVTQVVVQKISPHNAIAARKLKQVGGVGIEIYVTTDRLRLPLKLVTPAKISKNKVVDIEFVIDGFTPGAGQGDLPHEYRRLKY